MRAGIIIPVVLLICIYSSDAQAQDIGPTSFSAPSSNSTKFLATPVRSSTDDTIPVTVPKGTALQVVLDKEVRIKKVGQPIHGLVAEPVYAFDKLVVPVGTEVTGKITQLEGVTAVKRTLDILNAEFTPARQVQVEFDDLELTGGQHIPIHSTVTLGSGQVVQFIAAADDTTKQDLKDAASQKAEQAKQEAKRQWDDAMKRVREPGKIHKIEKYAVAQLPIHPQYIDAGTVYFAELVEPLDFGVEALTSEIAASINTPPPTGSSLHVRLITGLSSATARNGEDVEAVLSQPLFDGTRLVLPEGSLLKGAVVHARPARRFSRNGQLRMAFHELVLPDGIEQKVQASLEGVQSGKEQNVKLDSEGGAEANTPKTRYLATGIAVALAFASSHTDSDGGAGSTSGTTGGRVAGGVGGFKLVGIFIGLFVHSQPLGMAMGAYGASLSIYSHFIARGRDVAYPKNTAMEVGIRIRESTSSPSSSKPTHVDIEK
jgi:hypothetical protein